MVEILGIVAAVLLVLCLLLISSVLGYRAMLTEATADLKECERLCDVIERQTSDNAAKLQETTSRMIEAIEENTRLTGELAVAKLSLKNCQNQHAEMVKLFGQVKEERDDRKDMLRRIAHIFTVERNLINEKLREWQECEAQGEAKRCKSEEDE